MSEQQKHRFQYTVHVIGKGSDEYTAWDEAVDELKALDQDLWPEWQRVEPLPDDPDEQVPPRPETDVYDLVEEYEDIATEFDGILCPDEDRVAKMLHDHHDWTDNGAQVLVDLAMKYGAFILRNALALAIALNIEDGSEEM
jgi:hypothetical protein